jgi:hypothetical protein
MLNAAADWSKAQLIAYAAERGRVVTAAQFDRWRKSGLLPSPVLKGRGQGRGMQAIYSQSAGPQLVAVFDQLKKNRSVDAALWRLWWDGHPIQAHRIRSVLDAEAHNAARFRSAVELLLDDDARAEKFERATRARSKDRNMGRVRRRLGLARHATFVTLLAEVFSGSYASHDHGDALILSTGIGVSGTPVITPAVMHATAGLFQSDHLRSALERSQADEIDAGRDEMKVLLPRLIPVLAQNGERIFGAPVDPWFVAILAESVDEISPLELLVWLRLRAQPWFPLAFQVFSALLLRPLDEWIDNDLTVFLAPE